MNSFSHLRTVAGAAPNRPGAPWSRRGFLRRMAGTAAGVGVGCFAGVVRAAEKVGIATAFDREVTAFMALRNIPGGAVAVVKGGRLVYAQGYGYADREAKTPVTPTALFRIASVSKPFTGLAVLQLAAAGKLGLEDRVCDRLQLAPPAGGDARWQSITLRHLLHHTGGWDRGISGDPMFQSLAIAKAVRVSAPASGEAITKYQLGRPLDFAPGSRFAYSNFGYCLLGLVIEKVTGQPYADVVQELVLTPCGITSMRLGASLAKGRLPGEVHYYLAKEEWARPVFPQAGERVPWPMGGFYLEAMAAHGGWVASAVDLVRLAAAMDGPRRADWLPAQVRDWLDEAPAAPVARGPDGSPADVHYGAGWWVRRLHRGGNSAPRLNRWHDGSLPGTSSLLVRRYDGVAWAAVFNQRSDDPAKPDGAIDAALHRAADAVAEWPTGAAWPTSDSPGAPAAPNEGKSKE